MKKLVVLLLSLVLLLGIVGCTTTENSSSNSGSENDESKEESKKVLKLNNGSEPTSFDPPIGFDSVSWNALNNLMEGMTRLDQDDQPQPAAAKEWELSDDGKTYTFHLRDAKWSNGEPVTAEDFEYAWKRLANPDTASPAAFLAYFIEGAEAFNTGEGSEEDMMVKALDDSTLEVTLESPVAYFPSLVSNPAFFPVHKDTVEADPEWHTEADTYVSNGPFKLTKWEHDSKFVFSKNENYWDVANVKLDEVDWAMVDDTNTEYQMYKTGELHTSDVPADLSEELFDNGQAQVEDQSGTYFFRFNLDMEPFQNENIRKAFAMAVDQQKIVEFVTKNEEKPAHGFVAYGFEDASGGDFREVGGDLVTTDADKAKELLEKGMEEEGYDELPNVTLTYNTSDAHKKIAETLQQMYKEVLGVNVDLANQEWNVFSDEQKQLKLQFSRSSFLADYGDPINFLESFQTGHSMNRTGWSSEEYDSLIQQAKEETDEVRRFELMHEAEALLFEEMPIFPIHFYNQVYLQNEDVTGIVRHPVGYMELKDAAIK
ncbi:peptide ABC transporter substrate-binding protein [Guptibacillus hwajinpoensis]|uniref:Dipeptide transport system substrate-binding protein n=1 Tax=Guptibacillus hwajinpoensis TaxID=208199 RepID=A0ABU0K179_9BACL|nr:peptide ABC transporter substrate-binding protein [Alkalihalobacillus hemicentroti]MDQ0483066.1 dipeptide transport system substrate-binding protein [Alkalihalobacillus hemicentroti]